MWSEPANQTHKQFESVCVPPRPVNAAPLGSLTCGQNLQARLGKVRYQTGYRVQQFSTLHGFMSLTLHLSAGPCAVSSSRPNRPPDGDHRRRRAGEGVGPAHLPAPALLLLPQPRHLVRHQPEGHAGGGVGPPHQRVEGRPHRQAALALHDSHPAGGPAQGLPLLPL